MTKIEVSPFLEYLAKITLISANIAMIIGIWIALAQYKNAKQFNESQIKTSELYEKRKNAIDAVNKVYNSEFLNNLAKLKGNKNLNNNEMINAFNLVLNTYSAIAIVYNNNIADNQIIQKSIEQEVVKFVDLNFFKDSLTDQEKSEIMLMVNSFNKNL